MEQQIVKITKTKELDDAEWPNNIQEGDSYYGRFISNPIVGKRFEIYPCFYNNKMERGLSTSKVQEILSPTTFKTLNSIYEWKMVE